MKLADFWAQALRRLHSELSEQQFNRAIAPVTLGEQDGAWVLYAKNQFAVNLLRSQYAAKIAALQAELAPDAPAVCYKIGSGATCAMADADVQAAFSAPPAAESPEEKSSLHSETASKTTGKKSKKASATAILQERMNNLRPDHPTRHPPAADVQAASAAVQDSAAPAIEQEKQREAAEQRHTQTNLSSEYTFDTLVVGKGNQLPVQVAMSIAENPGDNMYNPFFVYGSTGLGKTHLVQAVGKAGMRSNSNICTTTCSSSTTSSSFRAKTAPWKNFSSCSSISIRATSKSF